MQHEPTAVSRSACSLAAPHAATRTAMSRPNALANGSLWKGKSYDYKMYSYTRIMRALMLQCISLNNSKL